MILGYTPSRFPLGIYRTVRMPASTVTILEPLSTALMLKLFESVREGWTGKSG
jgi:hypothetical protein